MIIKLVNIFKKYGNQEVLKSINFNLGLGDQVVIQGPSGAGKSTMLHLMGGLEKPNSGQVYFQGKVLDYGQEGHLAKFRNESIGFMFQFHFLLPTMTCQENILLPIKIGDNSEKLPEAESRLRIHAKDLGVLHLLDKLPYHLSGGEQQRVSLLRAIITEAPLLLCDEPTGNLDSDNSKKVIDLLIGLSTNLKTTLVLVTHDERIAARFNRKIRIEDGKLFG